jgi:hypothetical protein
MEAYQERVVAEKHELDSKIEKLDRFVKSDIYNTVPPPERVRLVMQLHYMKGYSGVLAERIINFGDHKNG